MMEQDHRLWFDEQSSLREMQDHLSGWHGIRTSIFFTLRRDILLAHENAHLQEERVRRANVE